MQGSRVLRSSSGGFRRVSPKPKIRPGISSQDIYELTTERSFVPLQSDAKLEAHANPPLFPWQEAALANLGVQCLECSCIDPSYQAAWDERRSEPGAGRSADAVQKADEDGYGFAVELLGGCAGRRCDCRVERVQTHFSHNFSLGCVERAQSHMLCPSIAFLSTCCRMCLSKPDVPCNGEKTKGFPIG